MHEKSEEFYYVLLPTNRGKKHIKKKKISLVTSLIKSGWTVRVQRNENVFCHQILTYPLIDKRIQSNIDLLMKVEKNIMQVFFFFFKDEKQ